MGRSTTRKSIKRKYVACKYCEKDIEKYGKCKDGFDNFYFRKNKNNGCSKCQNE